MIHTQINFESETPIYVQIAEQIEDGILSGAFPPETQVPSTTELSVSYRINPATVLKGMTILTDCNILYKKRGVGMFVKDGAAGRILANRRQTFYEHFVVNLLREADKLGIGRTELIEMIKKEENTDGN
ncbi:MAG: GntR family transcriptional regulator [Angelakisella sp.]